MYRVTIYGRPGGNEAYHFLNDDELIVFLMRESDKGIFEMKLEWTE